MTQREQLKAYVVQSFATLSSDFDEKKMFNELGVDSLDLATLLFELEDRFALSVNDGDEHLISSFDSLAKYFELSE